MGLIIAPPTAEPVDIADIKAHCRVKSTDDDNWFRSVIPAARKYIENQTDRIIAQTSCQLLLKAFDHSHPTDCALHSHYQNCGIHFGSDWYYERTSVIKLPKPPLVSVTSIQYVDSSGQTKTLDPSVYYVDLSTNPGRIVLQPDQSWPTLGKAVYPVTINYVAGYSTQNMPPQVRHIIRLLVAHWYANREAVADSAMTEVPLAVQSLINDLGWGSYLGGTKN